MRASRGTNSARASAHAARASASCWSWWAGGASAWRRKLRCTSATSGAKALSCSAASQRHSQHWCAAAVVWATTCTRRDFPIPASPREHHLALLGQCRASSAPATPLRTRGPPGAARCGAPMGTGERRRPGAQPRRQDGCGRRQGAGHPATQACAGVVHSPGLGVHQGDLRGSYASGHS